MTDIVEVSVALLRKYAEFTKKLTPEQLQGIAAGELRFALETTKKVSTTTSILDFSSVGAELGRINSRELAVSYINDLKLDAKQMRTLATNLGVSLTGVTKKEQFRDRIVEHTVGFRLNSETIRRGNWS